MTVDADVRARADEIRDYVAQFVDVSGFKYSEISGASVAVRELVAVFCHKPLVTLAALGLMVAEGKVDVGGSGRNPILQMAVPDRREHGHRRREMQRSPVEAARAEWARIRVAISPAVFERDGHRCVDCGTDESLSVDHIMPLALGGSHDMDNLATLCRSCNSRKGARTAKRPSVPLGAESQ